MRLNDPYNIERCVLKRMADYKVRYKKELPECSYNDLITEIASCIKYYDNSDIDQKPDIDQDATNNKDSDIILGSTSLRRSKIYFDRNKVVQFNILDDDEFDKSFEQYEINNDSDNDSNNNSNHDSDTDYSVDSK